MLRMSASPNAEIDPQVMHPYQTFEIWIVVAEIKIG
jgi:hypothetical protein